MNLRTLALLVIGACALPCWGTAATAESAVSTSTTETAAETPAERKTASTLPVPEPPAEGTLFRTLFGNHSWIQGGAVMELDFMENNHNTTQESAQGGTCANMPGSLNDCGFSFGYVDAWLWKPAPTNIVGGFGPIPAPAPKSVTWGYRTDIMYGRNAWVDQVHGWYQGWGINKNSSTNTGIPMYRQNYLGQMDAQINVFLPVLNGMMIDGGLIPASTSSEMVPAFRPTPNRFFPNVYALGMEQPHAFVGVQVSNNLYRNSKFMVGSTISMGSGFDSVTPPNGHPSFGVNLFYRTTDMRTSVVYAGWYQDGAIPASKIGDYSFYMVSSSSYQLFQSHSFTISHAFNPKWDARIEGMFGNQAGDGKQSTISYFAGVPAPPFETLGFTGATWHGINGDVTYKYKKNLWYSLRAETFSDPNGYTMFFNGAKTTINHIDAGLHYDLNKFTQFRPGVRYDWQSSHAAGQQYAFYNGKNASQVTGLMDVVFFF